MRVASAEEQERLSQVKRAKAQAEEKHVAGLFAKAFEEFRERAKAQAEERHVAGLYAKAFEEFRERAKAQEEAAAGAAEKEEGHKRQSFEP